MLSAPGLRFYRALAPSFQLDVGPAHPAVGWVIGYTPFLLWFSCVILLFSLFFFLFICLLHAPAYLGSPGWVFCAWVTRDVTSDSVPFLGFPVLAMPGLVCYMTCSFDTCLYSIQR